MARTIFHNTLSGSAASACQKYIDTALTQVLRAVELAQGLDAGHTSGPSRETECDAHPLSHPHALHYFAQGHQIEMICIFGATT